MRLDEQRRGLDAGLMSFRDLWHPQPFRDIRPAWCEAWPALTGELLALPDDAVAGLTDDGPAALEFLSRHVPEVAEMAPLAELPICPSAPLPDLGPHWAWEIPGRKRAQIEAFAAAAKRSGGHVVDWCGGKGHLGRLLALHWQVGATSLDIDPALCAEGRVLASRVGAAQDFRVADALAAGARLRLSRDDTRLAVTETVTASKRLARCRDREMAWKLGFDALRREFGGGYKSFKPVPSAWFAGSFGEFMVRMAGREGIALPSEGTVDGYEGLGWQRQREVMRLSIVRHAFRRALEIWLALDLAAHLEMGGYEVALGVFCPRELTPRNLLLSARR